jgi:hypothetical protein
VHACLGRRAKRAPPSLGGSRQEAARYEPTGFGAPFQTSIAPPSGGKVRDRSPSLPLPVPNLSRRVL